jgi:pilus assembly protein Flp/PilA
MSQFLKSFVKNESGATAIEYGLIAAGISVVIITAVGLIGGEVEKAFTTIAEKMKTAE